MKIFLAQPRGFCAGVTRAIAIVTRALEVFGAPIYVRHEIVHNRTVVNSLMASGAVFIEDLAEVPDGATLIFSAHGVPKAVEAEAVSRGLRVFDATCPLVTKVHREVAKMHSQGRRIIMIGHAGHPEVEGTMGQVDGGISLVQGPADVEMLDFGGEPTAYVSQTTISVDEAEKTIAAIKRKFPDVLAPKKSDVCYATQNRQDAVKLLARHAGLILVIGSVTSSNSNRLREMGERCGARALLIENADAVPCRDINPDERVGITAGASAPEHLVEEVMELLKRNFPVESVEAVGETEDRLSFPMPKGLWLSDIASGREKRPSPA